LLNSELARWTSEFSAPDQAFLPWRIRLPDEGLRNLWTIARVKRRFQLGSPTILHLEDLGGLLEQLESVGNL
jgi:hypothetical protein